jgi:hypothetical protein
LYPVHYSWRLVYGIATPHGPIQEQQQQQQQSNEPTTTTTTHARYVVV